MNKKEANVSETMKPGTKGFIQRRRTPRPKALWYQIWGGRSGTVDRTYGKKKKRKRYRPMSAQEAEKQRQRREAYIQKLKTNNERQKTNVPRKPVSKMSEAQRKKLAEYAVVKTRFLRDQDRCACCGKLVVDPIVELTLHHKRGRVGTLLTDTRFFMALHRHCHDWVHENLKAAQERGLLAGPGEWGKQE